MTETTSRFMHNVKSIETFVLRRLEDESGISGTGYVAEGVQFSNGKCVLAWVTEHQSIAVYDSMDELLAVHGHGGKTIIVWVQEYVPYMYHNMARGYRKG